MLSAKESHPSPTELAEYVAGRLNIIDSESVKSHLADCESCCLMLDSLPTDDTIVSALRSPENDTSASRELKTVGEVAQTVVPGSESMTRLPASDATAFASASEETLDLPEVLREHPRYRILELLGRGGMGDVYKAQHMVMNRMVALKVIKPSLVINDAAVMRFQREVQAAARLKHSNIVTAFDAEQAGDLHFLVMEFVDGEDLNEIVSRRGPLPVAEACEYIKQAAAGLQHAFEQGMVHRDIKPHNLMIEKPSGSLSGSPIVVKILDFGLANFATEALVEDIANDDIHDSADTKSPPQQLTQFGAMMGTPDYIAPEQAKNASTADIRADIYSLGCTFYKLLAGCEPFNEGSVLQKIEAHSVQPPTPIADCRDDVSPEVEAILSKMMAKDPADRFQQPAEIVAALAETLAPSVRPVSTSKTVLSNRFWAPVLLLLALMPLLAFGLTAFGVTLFFQTNEGTVRLVINDPEVRVEFQDQTFTIHSRDKEITVEPGKHNLKISRDGASFTTEKFQVKRDGRFVIVVDWLDGKLAAKLNGREIGVNNLEEVSNNRITLVHKIGGQDGAGGGPNCIAVSNDKKHLLISGGVGKTARFINIASGKQIIAIPANEHVKVVALSPVKKYAAAVGHEGTVFLWDIATGKKQWTHRQASGLGTPIAFSPNGTLLATINNQGVATIFNSATGDVVASHDFNRYCWNCAFSPDGKELLTSKGSTIERWSFTEEKVRDWLSLQGWNAVLTFSEDSTLLVTGSVGEKTGHIQVWDAKTGKELHRFTGHERRITSVEFLADERFVVSGGVDGRIIVWDTQTGREVLRREDLGHLCNSVLPVLDGYHLASFGIWDGKDGHPDTTDFDVRLWRLPKQKMKTIVESPE